VSTRRASTGGWVLPSKLPRGPTGRPLCRQCAQEIPKGGWRRTFCSDACVDAWRIKTDPAYLRLRVFERDHGICAQCSLDTMAIPHGKRTPRARGTGHLWQADHIVPVVEGGGECGLDNLRTLCTACHKAETAALRKRLAQTRTEELRAVVDGPLRFGDSGQIAAKKRLKHR
jgi:5-methylcytosine-specific restriction protein A